ncbi:MAG: SDR family oxidoreductase [Candidatus Lokiarchaeota archaeon]|nr:SDR family oxidoreductase [Candidatus Lokiarchaeota archaeon]MBD3202276.1 SDR family oxidoreductase [Candidatus Lokiarchaeota archaeon]
MNLEKRFEEKVAFITGGASGLGEKTAKDFAGEGAKVVLYDFDGENGKRVENEIKSAGGEVMFLEGDVREIETIDSAVQKTFDTYGPIDFLIYSAGILQDGMIHKLPEERWNAVIDTHLKGFFLSMQACVKRWIDICKADKKEKIEEYPDRRIITISSQAAEGNIGQLNYSAAKSGMLGMVKTAGLELIRYNIKTHAIMPTLIETPILGELLSKQEGKWRKYYSGRIPLGIGEPKYVSKVILFLCSDDAWFMNGEIIGINGGRLDKV